MILSRRLIGGAGEPPITATFIGTIADGAGFPTPPTSVTFPRDGLAVFVMTASSVDNSLNVITLGGVDTSRERIIYDTSLAVTVHWMEVSAGTYSITASTGGGKTPRWGILASLVENYTEVAPYAYDGSAAFGSSSHSSTVNVTENSLVFAGFDAINNEFPWTEAQHQLDEYYLTYAPTAAPGIAGWQHFSDAGPVTKTFTPAGESANSAMGIAAWR